jgi:hypothetical protein
MSTRNRARCFLRALINFIAALAEGSLLQSLLSLARYPRPSTAMLQAILTLRDGRSRTVAIDPVKVSVIFLLGLRVNARVLLQFAS